MAKAKVELAQAILDTWQLHRAGVLQCRHCGTTAFRDGMVPHKTACVVRIAQEIVDDDSTHDW
jgi:hypothetical protein